MVFPVTVSVPHDASPLSPFSRPWLALTVAAGPVTVVPTASVVLPTAL